MSTSQEDKFILVPQSMIDECPDFRCALRLCWRISGLPLKIVADAVGLTEKSLSRILLADGVTVRYFPQDMLIRYVETCRNLLPVQWLVHRVGGCFVSGEHRNFAAAILTEIAKGKRTPGSFGGPS